MASPAPTMALLGRLGERDADVRTADVREVHGGEVRGFPRIGQVLWTERGRAIEPAGRHVETDFFELHGDTSQLVSASESRGQIHRGPVTGLG